MNKLHLIIEISEVDARELLPSLTIARDNDGNEVGRLNVEKQREVLAELEGKVLFSARVCDITLGKEVRKNSKLIEPKFRVATLKETMDSVNKIVRQLVESDEYRIKPEDI